MEQAQLRPLTRLRVWWHGGRRLESRWATYDDVTETLCRRGVAIEPYRIDVEAFWRYVAECGYREMEYWQGGKMPAATEKWLEHYVSVDLLAPQQDEVWIDIASCTSPFPDILEKRYGVKAYRQDWNYPPGIHGDRIGGDAASLDLPDEFADKLTLHCSFEHFEGDRDWRFLHEAERILRPGGQLCILPLYVSHTYSIQTDVRAWKRFGAPELAPDATVCLATGYGETHGRFYDVERFLDRVVAKLGRLDLKVLRVENYDEVADDCYLKLIALFTKTLGLAGPV